MENFSFGLELSEYHTGYRAYSRNVLETVPFFMNSDKFVFDQEITAQIVYSGFKIKEVSVPTRYFPEASSASFTASVIYGFRILWLLFRYGLHKVSLVKQKQFESLRRRYVEVDRLSYDSMLSERALLHK